MLETILTSLFTSVFSLAIGVLGTLFFGKKSFQDITSAAVRAAMQQHREVFHRGVMEPPLSAEIDKRIEKAMSHHRRECRVTDNEPKIDLLFKKVNAVEKILTAIYIKNGGDIEDINGWLK